MSGRSDKRTIEFKPVATGYPVTMRFAPAVELSLRKAQNGYIAKADGNTWVFPSWAEFETWAHNALDHGLTSRGPE